MAEPGADLERQAAWQRSRRDLTWPEKMRLALIMREAALVLRDARSVPPPTPDPPDVAPE